MTRRALIQGLLLILGVDPVPLLGWLWRRAAEAASEPVPGLPGAMSATAQLSTPELEALVAFAEVLVEGRPLSPVERQHLVDHIEYRVSRDQYYVSLYRTTSSLLDRLAGSPFARLDVPQRIELMTRNRLTSSDVQPDEHLGLFPDDTRLVRTRALPDLIGGYYGSPAGWAAVGYGAFQGKCADLVRYTRPEA